MSARARAGRCRGARALPLVVLLTIVIPLEARAQQRCWVRGAPYTVDVIAQRDEFFRQMTYDKYVLESTASGWTWTTREGATMMPSHMLPPGSERFNTAPPTRLEVDSGVRDGQGRATWTQESPPLPTARVELAWTAPPPRVCEGELFDLQVEATVTAGEAYQELKIYYGFAQAMSQPRPDEDFDACRTIALPGGASADGRVGGGGSGPGVGGGYGTHVTGRCRRYVGPLAELDRWWVRLDLPEAFTVFYPYELQGTGAAIGATADRGRPPTTRPDPGAGGRPPDVTDPLTRQEIDTVLQVQEAAGGLWARAHSAYGDTPAARLQTLDRLREQPGVVAAGLTDDGLSIWIDYASGVEGGLMLNPPQAVGSPIAAAAGGRDRVIDGVVAGSDRAPGAPGGSGLLSALADALGALLSPTSVYAQSSPHVIENRKVLVWNPLALDFPNSQSFDDFVMPGIFALADGARFQVDVLAKEEADLASFDRFAEYGTVILLSHGAVHNGKVAYMTGEKATAYSEYWSRTEDLRAKRLVVYNGFRTEKHGYFVVYPEYVRRRSGRFPGSIIFAGGCQSLAADSMAQAFLDRGASIYFGWSGLTCPQFDTQAMHEMFRALVSERVDVLQAHGRLPELFTSANCKQDDVPLRVKLLYRGANASYYPEFAGGFRHDDYRTVYSGFDGVANDVEGRGFMAWTDEGELPIVGANVYCFDPVAEEHLIERFRSELTSGRHGPLTGEMEAVIEDPRSAQGFALHRGLCRIEASVNGVESAGSQLRSILARARSKIDERFPAVR